MKVLAEWQFPLTARDIARTHNRRLHDGHRRARLVAERRGGDAGAMRTVVLGPASLC